MFRNHEIVQAMSGVIAYNLAENNETIKFNFSNTKNFTYLEDDWSKIYTKSSFFEFVMKYLEINVIIRKNN